MNKTDLLFEYVEKLKDFDDTFFIIRNTELTEGSVWYIMGGDILERCPWYDDDHYDIDRALEILRKTIDVAPATLCNIYGDKKEDLLFNGIMYRKNFVEHDDITLFWADFFEPGHEGDYDYIDKTNLVYWCYGHDLHLSRSLIKEYIENGWFKFEN